MHLVARFYVCGALISGESDELCFELLHFDRK